MAGRRWQAPPGWPTPPPGWSPPQGWRPDPSWPEPPAHWQWWAPDPASPGPSALDTAMGFGEAMTSALGRRYATFTGRSRASEFWWVAVLDAVALAVAFLVAPLLPIPLAAQDGLAWALLALLVPSLAVTARRLHDAGRSGWWCLLVLVPYLGIVPAVVVGTMPGQPGPNRHGPPPEPPRTSARGRHPTPETSTGRRWAQAALGAVLGAVAWTAWLGWDTSYYRDAAGQLAGPYRPWQVVACAVTIGVLVGLLALRWSPVVAAAGVSAGFWVPWTVWAMADDDSGLWAAGALFLAIGLALGTGVAAGAGYGLRTPAHRLRERRRS